MKKQNHDKKLSLKKVQVMKLSNMKKINGGSGFQQDFYEDQDPTTPPIQQMPSAKCNG
ncbi:hypothetical protein [Chryseobacterium lathyri]|uniref:hypothetical protein n=1 Tax=Chryseobacterium lathyri TaxID=395933 RepID=UPI001CBF6B82|nr:hypothetical protein [Chryseobacterium lathyri]